MKPKKPKRRTKAEIAREFVDRYMHLDFLYSHSVYDTVLDALKAYERELKKRARGK